MNIAIIPAGGQGRRMQATGQIKQFLELAGAPIIIHTLTQFQQCPAIDAIQVVLPAAEIARGYFPDLAASYGITKALPPIIGGSERQASVYCGLAAIAQSALAPRYVAIHDAVRPFITPAMIAETIAAAQQFDGALCALAAVDTVKQVAAGIIQQTFPRSEIYLAQTPQTFAFPVIWQAHQRAVAENFLATDDAMLVEHYGGRVAVVAGSPDNIKITRPEDLAWAEFLLHHRRQQILPVRLTPPAQPH
jgi:2-C-methyl-D-erythritol 4-phosphate cytidylyltransferase